jgi:hypothetical protein
MAVNLYKAARNHDYQAGDYILIDDRGEDVGVSGNTDFWDIDTDSSWIRTAMKREHPAQDGRYLIIKIVEVSNGERQKSAV